MLKSLSIRDVLLIDKLELELDQGLNVLTGETGAGKSILLDCLGFVLGWRGRAEIVREGAEQGEVEAVFEIPFDHPANAILEEAGMEIEDVLILRRIVNRDGRKRGFLNDRSVSGEFLRQVGERLLEINGQHDDKGLLDEKTHLSLLDEFAALDLETMKSLYAARRALQKQVESARAKHQELMREADFIRHAAAELQALAPEIGEETALDEKRRLMQQSEKLAGDIQSLMQALGMEGAAGNLGQALRMAEGVGAKIGATFDPIVEKLSQCFDLVSDAEGDLNTLDEALVFAPHELEATEERLFAIRAAARKYHVEADELPAVAACYQSDAEALELDSGKIEKLEAELAQAERDARAEAEKLSQARKAAALALSQSVEKELAPLRMEAAKFSVEFEERPLSENGFDRAKFVVQPNPGAPAGSLSKIASGGELSRFLLALKLSLHQERAMTIIFDEIDRGVGGQTADAVGRRLRRLSDGAQLVVVTHSPQVSAMGTRHFLVSKNQQEASTQTDVRLLGDEARCQEIARMISGDRISEEALAAAAKLLETANV